MIEHSCILLISVLNFSPHFNVKFSFFKEIVIASHGILFLFFENFTHEYRIYTVSIFPPYPVPPMFPPVVLRSMTSFPRILIYAYNIICIYKYSLQCLFSVPLTYMCVVMITWEWISYQGAHFGGKTDSNFF